MPSSMTAFARTEDKGIAWEIRSVNQRYLDVSFKLPEVFRSIEPDLRNLARAKLHRGKVDCYLRFDAGEQGGADLEIDEDLVQSLKRAIEHISTLTGSSSSINPLEVLRWPGVVHETRGVDDALLDKVRTLFDQALVALTDMRDREGRELGEFIEARLSELEDIVKAVREETPAINRRLEARLRERLESVQSEVDTGRLEQELVYLAQKSDIEEELDRLSTHVEEIRSSLAQTAPMGRRLDFLMQELNREANTLSSKAVAANTSVQAVELKVLIEQMREQIQNIE